MYSAVCFVRRGRSSGSSSSSKYGGAFVGLAASRRKRLSFTVVNKGW